MVKPSSTASRSKKTSSGVPRLLTGAQPSLYLNMDASGAVSLTAPAAKLPASAVSRGFSSVGEVGALMPSKASKKRARPDTAGAAWGHMPAQELTEDLKRDLQIIRMRNVLDPKKFYKSSDMKKELPKYFQIGTMIDGVDNGGKRVRKGGTMLQEIMGDEKIRRRTKDQFTKLQKKKALTARPPRGRGGARGGGGRAAGKKKRT